MIVIQTMLLQVQPQKLNVYPIKISAMCLREQMLKIIKLKIQTKHNIKKKSHSQNQVIFKVRFLKEVFQTKIFYINHLTFQLLKLPKPEYNQQSL